MALGEFGGALQGVPSRNPHRIDPSPRPQPPPEAPAMLSRSSEYALRALSHLARHEAAGYMLTRTIAEDLDLPAAFLGKLLQTLVGAGLVESYRGRRGGFRLARGSGTIRLSDIVTPIDGGPAPRRGPLGVADSSDERPCALHDVVVLARERLAERLEELTLADLVRAPSQEAAELAHTSGGSLRRDPAPYPRAAAIGARIARVDVRTSLSTE
jgi:Rrf2 family protein